MPGYVMHLAMATKILDNKGISDKNYITPFLIGNIIPDIKRGNAKKDTHFWTDEMFKRFDRKPDLELFKQKYQSRMDEPYVFGVFCHLYLDAMYMERYWDKYLSFYDDDMKPVDGYYEVKKIKLANDDVVYDRSVFFSDSYYYGDYDRMNDYFVAKYGILSPKLDISLIENIKDIDEICIIKEKEKLINMVERVNKFRHEQKLKNDSFYEKNTKILNVKEIDMLIETVAKELSFY